MFLLRAAQHAAATIRDTAATATSRSGQKVTALFAGRVPASDAFSPVAPMQLGAHTTVFVAPLSRHFHAGNPFLAAVPGGCNIRLSNLPFSVSERQLRELCETYGTVTEVQIARRASDGLPLCWATVGFAHAADAEKAVQTTNGRRLHLRTISASLSPIDEGPPPAGEIEVDNVIYVGNLPADCGRHKLRMFFGQFGKVIELYFRTARKDGQWNTYAFVRFVAPEEAQKAILGTATNQFMGTSLTASKHNVDPYASAGSVALLSDTMTDVVVRNVPSNVSAAELGDFFLKFGEVTCLHIPRTPSDKRTGLAFVTYRTSADAERATTMANGVLLQEQEINVSRYCPSFQHNAVVGKSMDVFVTNVPFNAVPQEITDAFKKFGEIERVHLPRHPEGKCMGYAFVQFKSDDAAERAAAGMNISVRGRPVFPRLKHTGGLRLHDTPRKSRNLAEYS